MRLVTLSAFLAVATIATTAGAQQCTDGTFNCRIPAPAPKRVNPPLDDKTWIVLPFNNVTRAQDAEWLSDASVNLLSRDLSRWQDVHVIDDRRVADFMREVPPAVGGKLSFNDGVAVARRAGAGRLVIGDVLKVGSKTTITATVFNVRDGKQIRSAREETAVADSLMPLFGKLARGILAVAATDANVGSVGTSRADAFQEYIAGMQALNKFDGQTAKQHFEKALSYDTAFALAHYRWAIAATYDEKAGLARSAQVKLSDINNLSKAMEDRGRIAHAKAAARLSAILPARERKLIAGLVAMVSYDFPRACEAYSSLVAADSSDVEALYGYGMCLLQDDLVEPVVAGDTSSMRFRASWNTALRIFRRAILTDPTFHLAFDPIVGILTAPARVGCAHKDVIESCADTANHARYIATVTRAGDSLVTIPRGGFGTVVQLIVEAQRGMAPKANVEAARMAAADWAAAGPTEGLAHKHLAKLLLLLGRPEEAEQQIREALLDASLASDPEIVIQRLEIALKLFRGRQVNHLLDTLTRSFPGELGVANFASLAPVSGRLRTLDSLYTATLKGSTAPAFVVPALNQIARITAGVSGDTVAVLEAQAIATGKFSECSGPCLGLFGPGYTLALRTPRTAWPSFGPDSGSDRRLAPTRALAKHDTTALRAAAVMLDSVSKANARLGTPEDGSSAIAADAFLILNDTAAALRSIRRMMDTTLKVSNIASVLGLGPAMTAGLWPRALLVRADLEATATGGDRVLARDLYAKFLDLWANADPEFAPLLARVRASLAKLTKP